MKSSENEIVPLLGTAMGGGFYAGRIVVEGNPFALIVAPRLTASTTTLPGTARPWVFSAQ